MTTLRIPEGEMMMVHHGSTEEDGRAGGGKQGTGERRETEGPGRQKWKEKRPEKLGEDRKAGRK